MKKHISYMLIAILAITISSCNKDSDLEPTYPSANSSKNYKINFWIKSEMDDYYYWNDKMPNSSLLNYESSPESFFNNLLYKSIDKWSYITDDYTELIGGKKSANFSNGIEAQAIQTRNLDIYSVVIYTHKNSPAREKGLKRGNVIKTVNGVKINESNYSTILNQSVVELTYFKDIGRISIDTPDTITITATGFQNSPVIQDSILNINGKNIGYLAFDEYSEPELFKSEISKSLNKFQSSGVDNLILDLRYNGGGYLSSAQWLMSAIAPRAQSINKDLIIYLEFNKTINKTDQIRFIDTDYSFKFENISFLVSEHTASASELTIIGLEPYMNTKVIGNTTVGKCYASLPIYDEQNDNSYNYGIQPITSKYINSVGFTDFTDGLDPDILIEEDFYMPLYEFGNTNDPLLSSAINLAPIAKSASIENNINGTNVLGSTYSKTNRNLIIDIPISILEDK